MEVAMFSFRLEVPETQRDLIIDQVRAWDGVVDARRLFPDGLTPEIRSMCYAYITDETDPSTLVARLEGVPEIANAFVPPLRT